MTKQDVLLLGKYIAHTDPEMFDQLAAIYNTRAISKLGEKLSQLDPEMAESILADAKDKMLSPLQQTIKANNEWAIKMGVTPPKN